MYKVALPFGKIETLSDDKWLYVPNYIDKELIQWLTDNIGSVTRRWLFFKYTNFFKWYVTIESDPPSYCFYFKKKSDAILFKLTWG